MFAGSPHATPRLPRARRCGESVAGDWRAVACDRAPNPMPRLGCDLWCGLACGNIAAKGAGLMAGRRGPKKKRKFLAVDLFSGSGGLTVGLKRAGFEVVGAIERDPTAAETYRRNHRRTVLWDGDIRAIPASQFRKSLGIGRRTVDLLAGCPPCQGFSTLRTKNGRRRNRDARNDLVFEFLRFARVLKPKAVMLENVPGLHTDRRGRELAGNLEALGYTTESRISNVADYAVPQRRKRYVLIGTRRGAPVWPKKAEERKTVRDAIGDLPRPGKSGDRLHDVPENRAAHVRRLIAQVPKNGGSRSQLNVRHLLDCHSRCDGFYDVYGRMAWGSVSPTITTGCVNPSKGRFLHPSQNRCITLREAALLQTFPARYWFSLTRGKFAAAEQIGNALPPEFARRHALALKAALQQNRASRR